MSVIETNFLFTNKIIQLFFNSIELSEYSIFIALSTSTDNIFFPMIFSQLSDLKNFKQNLKNFAIIETNENDLNLYFISLFNYFLNINIIQCEFNYYKLKGGIILQMFYEFLNMNIVSHLKIENKILQQDSKYCIIFGGTGCIGLTFASVLQKLYKDINIIFVSRHATSKANKLKQLLPSAEFFDVDISDPLKIDLFFYQIKKVKKCEFIILCAGILPNLETNNEEKQNNNIFQTKLFGTLNIFNTLKKNNLKVNKFIFNSSLTAINGLPYFGNYAAANIFLDSITNLSNKLLNYSYDIVSIQWPAWSQSKMYQESKLFKNKFITQNSIDNSTAAKIIKKIIKEKINGVIAVAKINPVIIRDLLIIKHEISNQKEIEQINFKNNELDLETILIKAWKECLPKYKNLNDVKSSKDFFALGGNSLNGIQLIWKIEKALKLPSLKISIDWLFNNSKFDDFYKKIKTEIGLLNSTKLCISNNIKIINEKKNIPLSLSQEQMWILWNVTKGNDKQCSLYNIIFEIALTGPDLCINSVALTLRCLVAEQTTLRTKFIQSYNDLYAYQEVILL